MPSNHSKVAEKCLFMFLRLGKTLEHLFWTSWTIGFIFLQSQRNRKCWQKSGGGADFVYALCMFLKILIYKKIFSLCDGSSKICVMREKIGGEGGSWGFLPDPFIKWPKCAPLTQKCFGETLTSHEVQFLKSTWILQ